MTDKNRRQVLRLVVAIAVVALASIPALLALAAYTQDHTAYLPLLLGPYPDLTPAVCTG